MNNLTNEALRDWLNKQLGTSPLLAGMLTPAISTTTSEQLMGHGWEQVEESHIQFTLDSIERDMHEDWEACMFRRQDPRGLAETLERAMIRDLDVAQEVTAASIDGAYLDLATGALDLLCWSPRMVEGSKLASMGQVSVHKALSVPNDVLVFVLPSPSAKYHLCIRADLQHHGPTSSVDIYAALQRPTRQPKARIVMSQLVL